MRIPESELILNPDGSIYHLNLKPDELAHTIITVGDQDRVAQVSKHFDTIEVKKQHREFITHTGTYAGTRLTVISTGIGPDNIDIVLNELDALANIDFESRTIKKEHTALKLIRVGTSGALQPDIHVDSFVASEFGIGFDNLLHFYGNTEEVFNSDFTQAFIDQTNWNPNNSRPYVISADPDLLAQFTSEDIIIGVTTTNVGFYGPQGRVLRLALQDPTLNDKIAAFSYRNKRITNLEMETAAIYGMAKLLGHSALSLNVILANRPNGTFSADPKESVERLITKTLEMLVR